MTRVTRAIIDIDALQHNLNVARRAAPDSRVMAVIKANGYGHGIVEVAHALQQAEAFAVACIDEAITLREAGITQPIVLLEGFTRSGDLNLLQGFNLQPVIHHESQLALLEQSEVQPPVLWIKLDTGMHRLGFSIEQWPQLQARVHKLQQTSQLCYMTHLANADDRDDGFTRQQIGRFDQTLNHPTVTSSIANSAGILGWPDSHRDWNRPGIMLYGVSPFLNTTASEHDLRPVMTLQSELIAINHHRQGETIGYGGSWRCPEDMPVGVVAIGYGDGYPPHARAGTPVLLNGQRVPLIGRVSMDMLCVDLRPQPDAHIGDRVILWGRGLPVEEIAEFSGTIGYELLCKVTSRVTFEYQHD